MTLSGSIAFVTGGSSGLGKLVSTELAKEGASIAVGYRAGAERAKKVCREIEDLGCTALPIQLALEDPRSIEDAV